MFVIGNDKIGAPRHSAIHEFIIIRVGSNQVPIILFLNIMDVWQGFEGFQNEVSQFWAEIATNDLFVFFQDVGRNH